MSYVPPDSIWEVGANIKFDEPLDPGDERYVPTEAARGLEFSYREIQRDALENLFGNNVLFSRHQSSTLS